MDWKEMLERFFDFLDDNLFNILLVIMIVSAVVEVLLKLWR
jgi:hypothetical protein